ncbi:Lrp/AsnC family transcriptional regulator [Pseudooceanicola sp. 200-1SW]|uniref:Lrp/AsnC family transcriptional regulator n=1 Tax=Pseudooceanicola sp. 200-1SW TaxID=3425949 RepID=UPI003D7FC6E5
MLDDADRRILRQMQADPGASSAQIAERAGLTSATCWRRIERMQAAGIIRGVRAVIDWHALGYEVEVSLRIILDKSQPRAFEDFADAARKIPEVLEIQTLLGQVDVRIALIARDLAHYHEIYRARILTLPHVTDIDALMHVARVKYNNTVPL